MASRGTIPELPQEIIDQIIDEVAHSDDPDSQQTLDTLKSCALVSKAFSHRSRTHIFRTVNLVFDRPAGQKRAGRLLQILQKKDDRTPAIQSILRFNLLFGAGKDNRAPSAFSLSGMDKPFIRLRDFFRRTLETIIPREHKSNLNQVLHLIMNDAPLTHFSLGSRRGFVEWSATRRDIDHKLLRIVAKSSLKSLQLFNLMEFPEMYIRTAFQNPSLTNMRLFHLLFRRGEPAVPLPRQDIKPFQVAKIENLELRFLSYKALLAVIRTLELETPGPSGSGPAPRIPPIYSRVFSRLQTLSVLIPAYVGELEALWDIMQSAAPSLSILKIESHRQRDTHSPDPLNLSALKALKHLEFLSTMFREDTDVGIPELYLSNFLASATSPMSLESITLTLTIAPGSHGDSDAVFLPNEGWTLLDNALSNPLFVNLKSVVFNLKVAYNRRNDTRPLTDIRSKELARILLPLLSASPSVDTRICLILVDGIQTLLPGYRFEM